MAKPTHEEIMKFTMPPIEHSAPVVWYALGERHSRAKEVAFVLHTGGRTISLYTARGVRIDAVRHVDDPKLRLSVEQRENGAWDYTPEYLRLRELEERVAELHKVVADLEKSVKSRPRKSTPEERAAAQRQAEAAKRNLEAYRALQEEARAWGIDPTSMKKDALMAAIKDAKARKTGQT